MKKYEKLANEYVCNNFLPDEKLDDNRSIYIAGFLKCREMASEFIDQYPCTEGYIDACEVYDGVLILGEKEI